MVTDKFFDKSGAFSFNEMINHYNNWNSRREMRRDSQGGSNTSGLKKSEDAANNASKKGKKNRKVNHFSLVVTLFKRIFASYDEADQNTANKRAAINMALGMRKKYYPDKLRFWQELLDQANVLTDSRRFNDSCQKLDLDPQAVAEHLVMEGKANWNKVLNEGLDSYGEKVRMFKDRLYIDKYDLYTKTEQKNADKSE